jgi:hypothetical protein
MDVRFGILGTGTVGKTIAARLAGLGTATRRSAFGRRRTLRLSSEPSPKRQPTPRSLSTPPPVPSRWRRSSRQARTT